MNTIVEHINSAGHVFVEFALPMLVQSSVLIVILLLLDLLLRKKVKAVFRYWIWMLVLIKLILPTSLSSPLSLGYLFGEKLTYQDLAQTSAAPEPAVPAPADTSPVVDTLYIQPNPYISPPVPAESVVEPVVEGQVRPPEVSVTPLSWQGVVFLVWMAVVMAMGLLLLQRALFVRGLVAQAKKAGRLMNDALSYCCESMGIKYKVGLKISVNATTPSVCGLIRPVILVPWKLTSTLGASRLRTVLMHELAHIRRGDLWVNLIQTALQIIYFYNPLLWFANFVIRRVREQAVDEAVLVAMGEKAQKYPQTLVDVAKMAFKRPALGLRLIGVVESRSALAGRIKHILGRPIPKSARLGIVSVLSILITAAVLLPMARAREAAFAGHGGPLNIRLAGVRPDGSDNIYDGRGNKIAENTFADIAERWGEDEQHRTFMFELPKTEEPILFPPFLKIKPTGAKRVFGTGQHPLLYYSDGKLKYCVGVNFPRTYKKVFERQVKKVDLTLPYYYGRRGAADFVFTGPFTPGQTVKAEGGADYELTPKEDLLNFGNHPAAFFRISSETQFDPDSVLVYDISGRRYLLQTAGGRSGRGGTYYNYRAEGLTLNSIACVTAGEKPYEATFKNVVVSYPDRPAMDRMDFLEEMCRRLNLTGLSSEDLDYYKFENPADAIKVIDIVRGRWFVMQVFDAIRYSDPRIELSNLDSQTQQKLRSAAARWAKAGHPDVRAMGIRLGLVGGWHEFMDMALDWLEQDVVVYDMGIRTFRGLEEEAKGKVAGEVTSYSIALNSEQAERLKKIILSTDSPRLGMRLFRIFWRADEDITYEVCRDLVQDDRPWIWWPAMYSLSNRCNEKLRPFENLPEKIQKRLILVHEARSGFSRLFDVSSSGKDYETVAREAYAMLPAMFTARLARMDSSICHNVRQVMAKRLDREIATKAMTDFLREISTETNQQLWAGDSPYFGTCCSTAYYITRHINSLYDVNIDNLGKYETREDSEAIPRHISQLKQLIAKTLQWNDGRSGAGNKSGIAAGVGMADNVETQDVSLDHFVGSYALAKHPDTAAFEIMKKGDVYIFRDLGGPKFEMDILLRGLDGRRFEMEKGRDSLKFGDNPRERYRVRYNAAEDRYILDSLGMRGEVQDSVISPLADLVKIPEETPEKFGLRQGIEETMLPEKLVMLLTVINSCALEIDLNIESVSITDRNIGIKGDTSGRINTQKFLDVIEKNELQISQLRLDSKGSRDKFSMIVEPKKNLQHWLRSLRQKKPDIRGVEENISPKLLMLFQAIADCAAETKLGIESISITAAKIEIKGSTSSMTNTLKFLDALKKNELQVSLQSYVTRDNRNKFSMVAEPKENWRQWWQKHKADVQVKGEYNDELYQKQDSIKNALEFIGTPEELIDTSSIRKHGHLPNPRQLKFANKLFSVRKSKDVDMFISLLSDGSKEQLNDGNNRRMLHHSIKEIKEGAFLYGEYDCKFFATFREFTDEDRDKLKEHVSFPEHPTHAIAYWHFHKPNYMIIGSTYYLIEDKGSYKFVAQTSLSEPVIPAKKEQPTGPKEYGIVAFKQTDDAYTRPAVWKYQWNIELSPDVSEDNVFQVLKTTKVISGQADLHPEIAAQKIIDESRIEKYKYEKLKCRFYVGASEPGYNYRKYGRKLSGWLCGLSIAGTSKSTSMLFPGKDVTNVKPSKQGNFVGSDLELLSFETSDGNIKYQHKVILRKDDSPEAKSAALLRLEQMTRRQISKSKLQYSDRIMTAYANDHNSKYPDRMVQIKPYDTDEWLDWLLENIEYLGEGKTLTEPSKTVIAYDKTLLEEAGSTNVLFNDGPVQYCDPNWLKKLGIMGYQKTDVPVEVVGQAKEDAVSKLSQLERLLPKPPVGASKRVSYALGKISSLMEYIETEKSKNDDISLLSGYFDEINEFCDDLQGKNGGAPAINEWGQLSESVIKYVLEILKRIENTAEGCRDLSKGDNKELLNQHWQTLQQQYNRLCKVLRQPEHWNVKTNLSPELLQQRNKLLNDADGKIRSGLIELADKFPQLEKAKGWNTVTSGKSDMGRVSISLFHTDKGKARETQRAVPENERFGILVVINEPPKETWQLSMFDMYPNIGLVGHVGTSAGNLELEEALKKLVDEALEPIKQLDHSLSNNDKMKDVPVEVEKPVVGEWQDVGSPIPADFNDTIALTEQITLVSIGQDVEGKTFVTFVWDKEKDRDRKYRFVLINKKGTVLEPDSHLILDENGKLEEKFTFDEPYVSWRLKEFKFQSRPLPLAGNRTISSKLQKDASTAFEGKTISPSKLAPPGRYAIELDGVNDYLLVPDSPTLRLNPPFTIEMWIKPKLPEQKPDRMQEWGVIAQGGYIGTGRVKPRGFGMEIIRFEKEPATFHISYNEASDSGIAGSDYGSYRFDEWMHISHVFEGKNYMPSHGHPLVIGRFLIPVPGPFMGQIGEVRIWNGARTREEIHRYKNRALTGKEPGLTACWTFEQAEGQFAYDISGNNNHGRLGKAVEADDADPKWVDLEAAAHQPHFKSEVPADVVQGDESSNSKNTKPTVEEPVKQRGGISGVVVSYVTGEPIAGAYVGVGDFGDSGGSNYSRHRSEGFHDKTKTDAEGRFELGGLVFTDKHRYLKYHPLVVTHPDFVRHDEKIELLSNGPVPDVKVSLRPAAKIDVTIVDAEGDPLKGQWLIRLEALDGRRFIPPGSDPHLSSFASNIGAHRPDLRTQMGVSNGFAFTELDTGEYSIEALKFQLVDKPTPGNIWKPTITYHGAIPKIEIEAGQAKQVQLAPQDHQTRLTITPPEFPDKLMDKLERSSQMPLMCLISRSPGALLWDDGKIRHLEDQRLGRIDKKRFFRGYFVQGKPLTINNLPPDSYSLFAMAVYGQVAGYLIGASADLEKGDKKTVDIPWRQPTGPSMFGPNRSFDYQVNLESKDYSLSGLCEILTEITRSNPRIIADSSIENEKLSFGRGDMPVWDLLEKLYLDKGWRVDEGQEKTLIIKSAEQTNVTVEVKEHEVESVSVIRAVDNKATLASGLIVELLGLTEIPIKDNLWWKPDSSLLEQPPFDNVSFDPSRDPNHDQFVYYAVAMRLKGKAPGEIGLIKWDLLDALHAGTTSAYIEDKRVYSRGIFAGASKFPKDVETTTLRLGLAAGDWQTLVKGSYYGVYREGEDSIIVRTPERAGGPLGVHPGEKGLHIGVTYNVTDRDFRVVAVDRDGEIHLSSRGGSGGTQNLRLTTASFPDLTRDKLREFRFQTRPYEWIEFRDISLRPGKEVVALAEKRREDTKEELEKWLARGQTRRIRE